MNSDIFLILFIIFIFMMTLLPLLLRKIGIPAVIALLIAGMIMGPNCLNVVHNFSHMLSFLVKSPAQAEQNFNALITALGSLGLVFLMALAGMEADFKLIDSAKKPVIALSVLTFGLPALTGYFVYAHFCPDDFPGKLLYASLFASHSVGIVFPVIRELKLSKTKFGAAVLISTVVTDVASIILLAVALQMKKQELGVNRGGAGTLSLFDYIHPEFFGAWFTPVFLLIVVAFLVLSVAAVMFIGRRIVKLLGEQEDLLITFLLLVILCTVLAGEFLGINLIVGAFIAGLALSPFMRQEGIQSQTFFKFEGIGYGLLIPFLFISIGMQTDFSVLGKSASNLWIILLTVTGLVGSKIFSGWLALRLTGFGNRHGLCAGLMTVPQLSATLAAATVGKNLNMISDNFFNAIIILSIVTTIPVPSLVRFIIYRGGKNRMRFEKAEEEAYEVPAGVDDDIF
ncbi:MAG: cation:proton antiporter [Lentisphaeria bacterium]|nr:cation:proton antiporter [Lentisphaeria bacterium]